MKVFKFLVYLSLCSGLSARLSVEIRMVIDVVRSYAQPTAVAVNVCWRFSERYSLMSQLMKSKTTNTAQFVSDVKDIDKIEPITTLVVADLNCNGSRSFLEQANKDDMFSKPYRWLIIGSVDEFSKSTELTALKILVNTEVMIAEKTEDEFVLKLIYRIDMTRSYLSEEIGIWSTVDGCQISEFVAQNSMVIRRKDLSWKAIAASHVITDNRTRTDIHVIDRDLKTDNLAKITYHLIAPLYDFMNATKAVSFTNTWGYFVNNSWNGMVGDIDSGRAELCGTVSFMSSARVGIIQYISNPGSPVPRFLFRDPPLSFQNNLFILPFRGAVWLCIGGLVVVLIVVIYMNAKWENAKDEDAVMNDSTILKPDVSDIGIFVISAITQQGSTNELKGSLGRLVTFIMFLIFLFLYASYAANIVALLQSNSNQIRTLTDLLNSRLELGVENETYNRYYFSMETEPVRKAIYEKKVLKVGYKPNFMSLAEGVSKIRNKDTPFAFHMNLGMGYKIVEEMFHEQEKCDLHEISYYPNAKTWTCARKASPFIEIYKVGINRLNEHGLNDRFIRIFYVRKPVCNMRGGNFASVNMVDFHPVLLWMVYGMSLSVFLLVLEVLVHRKQKSEENKQLEEE